MVKEVFFFFFNIMWSNKIPLETIQAKTFKNFYQPSLSLSKKINKLKTGRTEG
jgi:hypothetical protein